MGEAYIIFQACLKVNRKICSSMTLSQSVQCLYTKLSNLIEYYYLQYLLMTAIYMLEPWERKLINSILTGLVAMAVYTGYLFIPRYVDNMTNYFRLTLTTDASPT